MKKAGSLFSMIPLYILAICAFLFVAIGGSKAVTVIAENAPIPNRKCVVIDAGHGGEDGGTVSYTGVLESAINLQIALRLDDLLHLLGVDTVMIRRTDCSIYTHGDTIAAKKVSDLKERVRIANETENALLVSIHQNHFSDSRYSGPQVFYSKAGNSEALAKELQAALNQTLNPNGKRQAKKADGIYLMRNIACTGILVECGFLSNPDEEGRLRDGDYQKKLCSVLAATCSRYLNDRSSDAA